VTREGGTPLDPDGLENARESIARLLDVPPDAVVITGIWKWES